MIPKIRQYAWLCTALAVTLMTAGTAAAAPQAAPPANRPTGTNDSGVQLNRTRQYLEWQRMQQRIAEGRETEKIEAGETAKSDAGAENIRFVLNRVDMAPSAVLTAEDIAGITKSYLGRDVSLQDIYQIIADINQLYQQKGYITCKAYLAPQTIKDGVVRIDTIEGKTGDVAITGNETTRDGYIRHRMGLDQGEIANIERLNEKLLLFNATNDVQLRIAMKAGSKEGTTDYVITAYEPQQYVFGLFSDNAGSQTSGLYRGGMFWQDRSLTGNRDSLFLSSSWTKGTKSFAAGYVTPINHNGTKLGVNYSTNSVHIIDGPMEPLNIKGHSYAMGLSLTQPIRTTETVKSEGGIEYTYQNSQTDFMHMPWVDDTIQGVSLFFDQIDYGRTTVFYQKHAYRFGTYKDITENTSRFGKYTFNSMYQKVWSAGQTLTARLDGQIPSKQYLPSAEQFYIGGMYSVRGYTESLLGGDGGVMGSIEYAVPLTSSKQTSAYVFLDGGSVWGASAFNDRDLIGTGFGIKSTFAGHMSVNVGVGFPLIRTVNDEEQSRARVHFSFNSQF